MGFRSVSARKFYVQEVRLAAIAPLPEQVKAGRVASFSLLTGSLCLKYIYFAEVQRLFLCQVPPLVCTQQQGFSLKFQHQLGFLLGKGKEKLTQTDMTAT